MIRRSALYGAPSRQPHNEGIERPTRGGNRPRYYQMCQISGGLFCALGGGGIPRDTARAAVLPRFHPRVEGLSAINAGFEASHGCVGFLHIASGPGTSSVAAVKAKSRDMLTSMSRRAASQALARPSVSESSVLEGSRRRFLLLARKLASAGAMFLIHRGYVSPSATKEEKAGKFTPTALAAPAAESATNREAQCADIGRAMAKMAGETSKEVSMDMLAKVLAPGGRCAERG